MQYNSYMSTALKYTGYGSHNALLDELEELKQSAQLRANDLQREDLVRACAQASADAYGYCQQRLMALPKPAQPQPAQ